MKLKWIILTLVCLVIAAIVIGVATTGWFGATETDVIKIGVIAPLTGELASWGQNGYAGAQLAIDEINANGGINGKKILLIVEDDKSTNDESVRAINKLLFVDDVDGIVFTDGSGAASAVLPALENKQTSLMLSVASNQDLTKMSEFVFRIYPSDSLQGKFAASYLYNKINKRNIAVISGQDKWAQGVREIFLDEYKKLGGSIVFDEKFDDKATDFKTMVSKLKSTRAEAIYILVHPVSGIALLKELNTQGVELPVLGGDVLDSGEIIKSGEGEGTLYTLPKINTPEDFVKTINKIPNFSDLGVSIAASTAYDSTKILIDAIDKANSTNPEAVQKALTETNYKGISNPVIQFDSEGDIKTAEFEVRQIVNKESVVYEQ